MKPYYRDEAVAICLGDCREVLPTLKPVDAIVTDPPYGLGFMGQEWDKGVPGVEFWSACLRALKPGGHLLAFGGTRMHHRLWCAIEDAGFEVRDTLLWMHGTGFPKSLDVSKDIDKGAGHWRGRAGAKLLDEQRALGQHYEQTDKGSAVTDAAKQWEGWGTALKPSWEPILWATKPLTTVPIAATLLAETQVMVGGVLCQLLSNASSVNALSRSSPNVSDGEFGSVLLSAAVFHGSASAEWCEKMATYNSPEMVAMCLSIVKSWRIILDVVYQHGSRFTTSMATELTTALKTLNSCLSNSIPLDIIQAVSRSVGELSTVPIVGKRSRAERGSVSGTRKRIAAALASLQQARKSAPTANENIMPVVRSVDSVLRNAITDLAASLPPELSPSVEPILLARKPLEGTVAENVLKHGVGGLNIDATRIGGRKPQVTQGINTTGRTFGVARQRQQSGPPGEGRWPANVLLDEEAAAQLDEQSGDRPSGGGNKANRQPTVGSQVPPTLDTGDVWQPSIGGASRFFYVAKASRAERERNITGLAPVSGAEAVNRKENTAGLQSPRAGAGRTAAEVKNPHPTVKPLALMRWLVLLVTPPNGVVLDPFMGSGSTLRAAKDLGRRAIGIEIEERYCEIAAKRMRQTTLGLSL